MSSVAERRGPVVPRLRVAATLSLGLAVLSGCRGQEPPVGRLAAAPGSVRLPYPQTVAMTFEWTPSAPLGRPGARATVFVHLRDAGNHVIRTFDHELPGAWVPGTPLRDVFDLYQSALGPPLPPGRYALTAGLYDPHLGYRWPLASAGPDLTGKREYRIADVDVPPGRATEAGFRFEGQWSGSDPGKDGQVLARRWLTGPGSLVLQPSRDVAAARLVIRVVEDLALGARVTAPCALSTAELAPGAHWLEVRPTGASPCAVRFESSGTYGDAGPSRGRWLALEILAFRAP